MRYMFLIYRGSAHGSARHQLHWSKVDCPWPRVQLFMFGCSAAK